MRSEKVRHNGCLNEDLKSYSELCQHIAWRVASFCRAATCRSAGGGSVWGDCGRGGRVEVHRAAQRLAVSRHRLAGEGLLRGGVREGQTLVIRSM